jgi:fucose permease
MIGSLSLPLLAILLAPSYAFLTVAACAAGAIVLFETLRPAYPMTGTPPAQLGVRERVRLVASDRRLATLALASMPYSALQVALNTCFVSFGAFELGLTHVEAGAALAAAQAGGLAGRIGWGLVAMRLSARRVLVLTGLGMATAALAFGISGALLGKPAQFALAGLFGLTASGWNGVFIAEIARLAPSDRVAETTGAVLTASFAGLLLGPLLIAGLDRLAGLGGAFIVLGVLSAAAALALSRDYERK